MIRYREPYRSTYDRSQDSFRLEFALIPCLVLAMITSLIRGFGFIEVRGKEGERKEKEEGNRCQDPGLVPHWSFHSRRSPFSLPLPPPPFQLFWTFSIYLEAVAILPQLIVLQRYSVVENLTGHYIFFLGAYRGLYILNWVGG